MKRLRHDKRPTSAEKRVQSDRRIVDLAKPVEEKDDKYFQSNYASLYPSIEKKGSRQYTHMAPRYSHIELSLQQVQSALPRSWGCREKMPD